MFLSRLFGRKGPAGPPSPRPTVELGQALPPEAASSVSIGVATDPGCVRAVNEDSIQVVRPSTPEELEKQGILAVVCDGMGGHEAGEVASRLAIEAFVRDVRGDRGDPTQALVKAMLSANAAVMDAAKRDAKLTGMGTTCTAVLLRNGFVYCAHVGDSRCYMIRDREIFLMTEDHSAVMEMVRRGAISLDEARHHPDKNVISRALGSQKNLSVTTWPRPLQARTGDRYLVCSDGLYDLLSDAEIADAIHAYAPQAACDALVQSARERGGFDNISVAILAVGESTRATSTGTETRSVEVVS